jgi:predicted component of type VI protein secretion system
MMTLTLAIVRCPHGETPPARTLTDGTFTIGRAKDNDWALSDPDRFLSKRHCSITLRGTTWELVDNSANGTYLNRDPEPIGAGRARDLRDGDRLLIGDYEIEVRIVEQARPTQDTSQIVSLDPFASALRGLDPAEDVFTGAVQPDHSPGIEDAFRPPRPVVLLGEDWDLDGSKVSTPRATAPPPVLDHPLARPEMDLLSAFLRGAGLPDARPENPEHAMEALGAAFRALVKGLREALVMRAATKREFRIRETMIRSHGNNPLKFAASEDDALVALLGVGRRTDKGPAQAVSEAMRDIRLHELASMAAMQTAVRGLLRELAPAKLREEAGQGGVLESQRKARAWDLYEAQHARLLQGFADDFDSVFGRAFAVAYERALEEARSARSGS